MKLTFDVGGGTFHDEASAAELAEFALYLSNGKTKIAHMRGPNEDQSPYGDVGPGCLATSMCDELRRIVPDSGVLRHVSDDQLHAMDAAARYHHNDVAAFACGIQQDEDGCLVVKGKKLTLLEEDVLFGALVHRAVKRRGGGAEVPFRSEHFKAFGEQE